MKTLLQLAIGLLLVACGAPPTVEFDAGSSDAAASDTAAGDTGAVSPDGAAGDVLVTIENGWGTGRYPVGAEIHVFADAPPEVRTCSGWTGEGRAFLTEPEEWHTTMTVPDHDVTVTATFLPAEVAPTSRSYLGVTSRPKQAFLFRPAGAIRGLLLVLHGTGGSARLVLGGESLAVVQRAVANGWAVLSPESEESVAGDLNGDDHERWDVSVTADNLDLGSLSSLLTEVRTELGLEASAPNAVLGMSNGGAMALALGAVSVLDASGSFPELRFRAAVVHCASGRENHAMVTTTPTAFLGCSADDHEEVDLLEIERNSMLVDARGVRTLFRLHPPSPLFRERFTRVPGVDVSTSAALVEELSPWLDAAAFFTATSRVVAADVMARPAAYPQLAMLAPAQRGELLDQIRVAMAAHQMYSDWAAASLAFLEAP
jgi:dienelactone hydrolase